MPSQRTIPPKQSASEDNIQDLLRSLLSGDSRASFSKIWGYMYGLHEAILLSDLFNKECYFNGRNMTENGWFFNTEENRQKDTLLTPAQQRRCINVLTEFGVLLVERRGSPARQWFKINHETLVSDSLQFIQSLKNRGLVLKEPWTFNRSNKRLSKDSLVPGAARDKMVEYWNSLKYTQKHEDPSTKTYKRAARYFRWLRRGEFGERCDINKEWLKKKKVPLRFLTREWTDKQIKDGIDATALMFSPGHWPYNKAWVPRALSSLLHNPHGRNSWFLAMTASPPSFLDRAEDFRMTDEEKDWIERLDTIIEKKRGEGEDPFPNQRRQIRDSLIKMKRWYNELPREKEVQRILPTFNSLVDRLCEWVEDSVKKPRARFLGPGSLTWEQFEEHLERDVIGISLKDGRDLEDEKEKGRPRNRATNSDGDDNQ